VRDKVCARHRDRIFPTVNNLIDINGIPEETEAASALNEPFIMT
jgi:hypothetical protein